MATFDDIENSWHILSSIHRSHQFHYASQRYSVEFGRKIFDMAQDMDAGTVCKFGIDTGHYAVAMVRGQRGSAGQRGPAGQRGMECLLTRLLVPCRQAPLRAHICGCSRSGERRTMSTCCRSRSSSSRNPSSKTTGAIGDAHVSLAFSPPLPSPPLPPPLVTWAYRSLSPRECRFHVVRHGSSTQAIKKLRKKTALKCQMVVIGVSALLTDCGAAAAAGVLSSTPVCPKLKSGLLFNRRRSPEGG